MAGTIYKKPILFAVVVTVAILIGTAVMMVFPMLTPQMHPKLQNLKPYTALQLAGRDVYQEEGCFYCHTQTVRPLKAEVMRYGEYSKAGEFAYDQPFLWGSKRTGPDIARVGGKYTDKWHYKHFNDPRKLFQGSNMPSYGWLADRQVDAKATEARMKALGFPYTKEEIETLSDKTKLDALVAYMQSLGHAVPRKPRPPMIAKGDMNPLAGDMNAVAEGKKIYEMNCAACHGVDAKGDIGPDLTDKEWLYVVGTIGDDTIFFTIADGTKKDMEFEGRRAKGGMPSWGEFFGKKKIWSLVTYIRSIEEKE
ncbi:MAG: cbb3-type cytochrome c oxidase subunit II [Nitrospirae bacterium]|nr:cbb3-type cytochrome c oxidase subunit II [Nitrospirota bacterium]MCL5977418.1 cbb3-type cytochrome c oxidase subunit II [Nitrospirota bacterium]